MGWGPSGEYNRTSLQYQIMFIFKIYLALYNTIYLINSAMIFRHLIVKHKLNLLFKLILHYSVCFLYYRTVIKFV